MAAPTSPFTNILITVLAGLMLASMGFIGSWARDTNDKTTELGVQVPEIKRTVDEKLPQLEAKIQSVKDETVRDVKAQIAAMVTRPELESRISETKVEIANVRLEQQKVILDIYALRAKQDAIMEREANRKLMP
jgi:hypothetical protein